MAKQESLIKQKQQQMQKVNLERLTDDTQLQETQEIITQSLQRQMNPITQEIVSNLVPESYVSIPAVQEPPQAELSDKEKKKKAKQRRKAHDKTLRENESLFRMQEDEEYNKAYFSKDLAQSQERAQSVLLNDIPNLLSFDFGEKLFAQAELNAGAIQQVKGWLGNVEAVLNADTRSVMLERLNEEQVKRLDAIIKLREPFAAMERAANNPQDIEAFTAATNAYREALGAVQSVEAGILAAHMNELISANIADTLGGVTKEQAQLLSEHPEYQWMGDSVYLQAHREQMQRCYTLPPIAVGKPAELEASAKLMAELQSLAAACGKMDCRRKALAAGLRKLREEHSDSRDIAVAEATLEQYRENMDRLSQKMGSIENAMSYLHTLTKLSAGASGVLAETGYDVAASQQKIIDDAGIYAKTYNAKREAFDRIFENLDWSKYPGYSAKSFEKCVSYSRGMMMMDLANDEKNTAFIDLLIRIEMSKQSIHTVSKDEEKELTKEEKDNMEKLPQELYDELMETMQPYFERMLSYDVQKLSNMPEDDLPDIQDELIELSMANMMASDLCLKKVKGQDITVKNAMLYQRDDLIEEFSNRSLLLNNYLALSRSISLLRACKAGIYSKEMTVSQDWTRFGNEQRTLEEDENQIRTTLYEKTKNFLQRVPKSKMKNAFTELKRDRVLKITSNPPPTNVKIFDDVIKKFRDASNMDPKQPMSDEQKDLSKRYHRIQGSSYHLAGSDVTIKEPIFRSFTSFLSYEEAQKMSDEEFLKMLMDLSEGYDLNAQSPPEKLEAARQKNMEGIAKVKSVMHKQYDYLARKFGTGVENMTFDELAQHYWEFNNCIRNGQVDFNILTRLPGAIDRENPDDLLLLNRVNYFYMFFGAIMGAVPTFTDKLTLFSEEDVINGFIVNILNDPDVVAAKEYLARHAPMPSSVDWSVKS